MTLSPHAPQNGRHDGPNGRKTLSRRMLLAGVAIGVAAPAALSLRNRATAQQGGGEEQSLSDKADGREVDVTETKTAIADFDTWQLSEEEWKARLSPAAYAVLRREGTERPWSSDLNDEKRAGIYACAGCGLDLFRSETKYESGTGWPSFYDAIDGALGTSTDYKLVIPRTEYHCARCGGHQGHVFKDGPAPTGLRYCNNGVALTFRPDENA